MGATVKELRDNFAEMYPHLTEDFPNTKFNFTPISLKKLNEDINRRYPEGTMPSEALFISMGMYLGEVVVRNIKGSEFVDSTIDGMEDFMDITISVPAKVNGETTPAEVKPFVRVFNTLQNRHQELFGWYKMIDEVSKGKLPVEKPNPNKPVGDWKRHEGIKYRVRDAD